MKFFVLRPDGDIAEVLSETGMPDHEMAGIGSDARPQNTASLVRLSGGKAKLRFKRGEPVALIASLPVGIEPRQLELLHYERRGNIRVVYLQAFGDRRGGHWNTVSFRAGKLADGRWKLAPAGLLEEGEYCFTPRDSDQNYCFGVD